jgi:hypothetical protein
MEKEVSGEQRTGRLDRMNRMDRMFGGRDRSLEGLSLCAYILFILFILSNVFPD